LEMAGVIMPVSITAGMIGFLSGVWEAQSF
jgi:hypothetical protein